MFFDESAIEFVAPAWEAQPIGFGGVQLRAMEAHAVRRSNLNGIITSGIVHGVVLAALLSFSASRRSTPQSSSRPGLRAAIANSLAQRPRPGGGGGGGGKKEQSPARAARVKGGDAQTMPAAPRAASDADQETPPPVSLPMAGPNARRVRADRIGFDRSRGGFTVVWKRHRWRRRNWSRPGSGAKARERTGAR